MPARTSTRYLPSSQRGIRPQHAATSPSYESNVDTCLANPFMGHQEPEVAERLGETPEHVRSFLYRNHRCYYIVTDEEMRVLGFIHTSRDRDTVLEERFPGYPVFCSVRLCVYTGYRTHFI